MRLKFRRQRVSFGDAGSVGGIFSARRKRREEEEKED
jgi:hypothetical protein|tara:strand:+ start:166 stop:276 length:111 start_codon:yes stop_codon:yes gene_type:complete